MKNLTKLIMFILSIAITIPLYAQNNDEEKVLKLNSDFDKASLSGDLSFFEKVLAPEYTSYHPDGSVSTKPDLLAEVKKENENPTFKFLKMKSEDVKVKIDGNLAYVTGLWKATTQGLNANSPQHDDTGFYSAAFEKRGGNWLMISDHATEKEHTPAELEPSLRKASEDYDKAIMNKDAAFFEDLFSEDYASINTEGKITTKSEEIAQMKSPDLKIFNIKTDDKKFRIYRNTAIETGRFNVKGSYKGEDFSEIGRYTSTWFYRNGKWMMASDHTSTIKN